MEQADPNADADADADAARACGLVREFRQILLWPVQLVVTPDASRAAAHWERLMARDCAWQPVADELTDDSRAFGERHYTEFVAFMPDVQRFLYGEGDMHGPGSYGASPIHSFRRDDIAHARVTLRPGDTPIDLAVVRVELHFFYDIDLAMLAVEVVGRDLTLARSQDLLFRLGRAYPTSWAADGSGVDCCAQVQLLAPNGHILATSDYDHKDRYLGFVRVHRAPCIAAHWAFLLEPLAHAQANEVGAVFYRQLEHQRIPLLAYLAIDNPYAIDVDDWRRLGLAAPPGATGSSPFAAGFLADFEARCCYDRFWDGRRGHDHVATRILCSGHAFVMVGEARAGGFTDSETGILAQFRHQYFLLGLIAHFHRAALLIFRDRLVSAMSQLRDYSPPTVKRFKREIRQTHENFLRFTHRYWFQEVSNQAPAHDLFGRWVAWLGSDRLFAEVRQEVLDMIAYLDSDGLRRQANTVVRLTVVTFFGLIGTIVTGFLGMNLIDLTEIPLWQKVVTLIAVLIPVTGLTFYTAGKSQRLADFLDAVSDARQPVRIKLRALARVWRRE